jgi:hypothetical protein
MDNPLLTAALAAQAWFVQHPKRIIVGSLAEDEEGQRVSPTDESAVCFCALGRVCKELGVEVRTTGEAIRRLNAIDNRVDSDLAQAVYLRNDTYIMDEYLKFVTSECNNTALGSIDGINHLVEKLNG